MQDSWNIMDGHRIQDVSRPMSFAFARQIERSSYEDEVTVCFTCTPCLEMQSQSMGARDLNKEYVAQRPTVVP